MINETEESETLINYNFSFLKRIKWLLALFAIFTYSILTVIPFQQKIDGVVFSALKSIPGCSIKLADYKVKFFPPGVSLQDLKIPGRCLKAGRSNMIFKEADFLFRGLSFSPFGPHFKLETSWKENPLNVYMTYSGSSMAFNIQENTVNLKDIESLFSLVKFAGTASLSNYTLIQSGAIQELMINLSSKDFALPGQNIMGLALPYLRINDVLLQGQTNDKGHFIINNLIMGSDSAPIKLKFKGKVKLNRRNIMFSNLDLKGEVQFGQEFLKQFSIVQAMMQKFSQKDGYYQIKVTGTLSNPKTQ